MTLIRRLLKLSILLALATIVAAASGAWYLNRWANQPTTLHNERIIEFPPGTPLLHLAQGLANADVVSSALEFYSWVRLFRSYESFQAGRYRFANQISPAEVAHAISNGQTYNPIVLSITIPEGFPLRQVIARLAANRVGTVAALKRLAADRAFLQSLKVPTATLEGFLYPATYNFTEAPTARQAFEAMTRTFWETLPKNYEQRVNSLGLTLGDAVTFASLIETETLHDDERPLISEVIWRRLKDKVPLAIDAALIYGIPDYAGDLKWAHLADKSNPYNTRIHRGLPPTPIGAPSLRSLEAVLTPSNKGIYYYVLIPGSNRHHFSKTLKEHNEHVKKLVKASKRKKDP